MASDIIQLYLKELKNRNSNKEKSIELIQEARNGNVQARTLIIKDYLLLVYKIARTYDGTGVPISDIISEGNIGLIMAIDEKYDLESGSPFSTCAKYWIKHRIIRNCMHSNRLVRLPENISELQRTGRWTKDTYSEISINQENHEGHTLSEILPDVSPILIPFQEEEEMINKSKIESYLSFLSERDSSILKKKYGISENEMSVEEISKEYGLTVSRVKQIEKESVKTLKEKAFVKQNKIDPESVIEALYGKENSWLDVSDHIKKLLSLNKTFKISNKIGGDPISGTKKVLRIKYHEGGEIIERKFYEGSLIEF